MFRLLFCTFFLLPPLLAEEVEAHYQLIAPKDMEDEIVKRVEEWMKQNLHYDVRVQRKESWKPGTGDNLIKALLPETEKDVIVTVILSPSLDPLEQHAFVDPERRVGVIHVGGLVPAIEEKTLRRLDRQAMRIVGFALGIPPQPIPFCCLFPYRSLEELDAIGRGFSPPAQALYRKQLVKHGIPLSKDAKQRLPDVKNIKIPKTPPPVKAPSE